jgi:hypothetical protein
MLAALVSGDAAGVVQIDRDLGAHIAGTAATLPLRSYLLALADRQSRQRTTVPAADAHPQR